MTGTQSRWPGVQQRTVDVLASVMAERGRVELYGPTSGEARSARSAVDEAVVRLDAELLSLDAEAPDRSTLGDLTTLLGQIDDIRRASMPGESYTIAVTAITMALQDANLAITSGSAISNRRQFSALVGLLTTLGQQRRLVGHLVNGEGDQSTATELLVTQRSAEAARAQFEALSRNGSGAPERVRAVQGSVDALATQVVTGPGSDVDLDGWWDAATGEIDAVRAEMAKLTDALVEERSAAIGTSRNDRNLVAGAVAATLGIVALVAFGAVAAVDERRRAAVEYQQLADGIMRWFNASTLPALEGLDAAAAYRPASDHASAGGDWFDLYPANGQVIAVVGDVVGHGPAATADMARIRYLIRGLAAQGAPPRARRCSTSNSSKSGSASRR